MSKKKPVLVTIAPNLTVEIDKPGAPVPYKILDPKTKKPKRYSRKDAAIRGALRSTGGYLHSRDFRGLVLYVCEIKGKLVPIRFLFTTKKK